MKTTTTLKEEGILTDERAMEIVSLLPSRFKDADIEAVEEKVKEWLFGEKPEKKGLYLFGPVGTGKTFAAYAIYRTLKENGKGVKIGNAAKILTDIKDDFKYGSRDPYYASKFDAWVDFTGIMIIDDIGAEKPTEWALETFYQLINERYENMRPTIFTSNLTVEEIAGRMGDRIASRIAEMCTIMKLDGEDRRLN